MKPILGVMVVCASHTLWGQAPPRPKPFEETRKAMAAVENIQERQDSLMGSYDRKWSLDFRYGQRFIAGHNKANAVDSVTLTDFTSKRAFYGVGTHHFVSQIVRVGFGLDFLILPRKQEVTSFSGGSGSGSGSGGLIFSAYLSGDYFFAKWGNTRPYVGLMVGRDQLIAKGGKVRFSLFSGRDEDINERTISVFAMQVSAGLTHRMAPGSIIDFNIGYSGTAQSEPIGGITSPGGVKASLMLLCILNVENKKK